MSGRSRPFAVFTSVLGFQCLKQWGWSFHVYLALLLGFQVICVTLKITSTGQCDASSAGFDTTTCYRSLGSGHLSSMPSFSGFGLSQSVPARPENNGKRTGLSRKEMVCVIRVWVFRVSTGFFLGRVFHISRFAPPLRGSA